MKRYYTLDDTEELESLYMPKILFDENSKYFDMSLHSKLLYAILLDKSNGSYFNYRQTELCDVLGITPKTLRKYLKIMFESLAEFKKLFWASNVLGFILSFCI